MASLDDVPVHEWEELAHVLDARVDDLSEEQKALAVERTLRRLEADEFDARDEDHVRILRDELRAATLRGLLDRLVARGKLEVAGIADTGYSVHRPPPGTYPGRRRGRFRSSTVTASWAWSLTGT